MGCRAQVYIEDDIEEAGVYLYTHWGAEALEEAVRTALSKKWRWDDAEYLTRIIFCEMVKGQEAEETGFGIGISRHADIRLLVVVDCAEQKVTIEDVYQQRKKVYTFEEFIKKGDDEK